MAGFSNASNAVLFSSERPSGHRMLERRPSHVSLSGDPFAAASRSTPLHGEHGFLPQGGRAAWNGSRGGPGSPRARCFPRRPSLEGSVEEDPSLLPTQSSSLHDGLRLVIERLDRLESHLDLMGEQIVKRVLGGKSFGGEAGAAADAAADAATAATFTAADSPSSVAGTFTAGHEISAMAEQSFAGESDGWEQASNKSLHLQHGYQLRPEWQVRSNKSYGERTGSPVEEWRTLDDYDTQVQAVWKNKPWWIIWPSSRLRMCWDILTMFVVAHDMAVIPVTLAFDAGDNYFSNAIYWPTLLFWTLDIPLTMVTGFFHKGRVEIRFRKIATEYLRTWFVLDAILAVSAWCEFLIGTQTRGLALGRVGKTLRILRVMRTMRLLRLIKLRRIIEDIQDRVTSEYFHIVMSVFKLILIIVWTNHFIGCMWWSIGISGPKQGGPDAEWSWTSHFLFQDDDLGYQYFTALHWSLTQFTPASMEVSPRNLGERIFAVLVLLFAMIVFSSFVSSITAAMTQLRQLSSSVDKGYVMLRRYLRVRNTPSDLTVRIVRCVEHRLGTRKGEIPESDVALLQHLSKPLQMELLSHNYAPYFTRHPFFQRYSAADPVAMQRMCLAAVQRVSLSTGDALFSEACSSDQMFFVLSGKLRYYAGGCISRRPTIKRQPSEMSRTSSKSDLARSATMHPAREFELEEGDWFCESSLWCHWAHWGTMVATRMCEVLAVDAAAFASVTNLHRLVSCRAQRYGAAFVDRLNTEVQDMGVADINQLTLSSLDELAQQAFSRRNMTSQSSQGDEMNVVKMQTSRLSSLDIGGVAEEISDPKTKANTHVEL